MHGDRMRERLVVAVVVVVCVGAGGGGGGGQFGLHGVFKK